MRTLLTCFLLTASLVACQTEPDTVTVDDTDVVDTAPVMRMATATLSPTEGSSVSGQVTFTETDGGISVSGSVSGLTPGEHGFHVHENGACGPGDDGTPGGAAGGHFAPQGSPHGAPTNDATNRHVGDLGNITAGDDSTATVNMTDPILALEGANSIVGKAVVVHSGMDDLTSQPSGDAGSRVACGVITMQ